MVVLDLVQRSKNFFWQGLVKLVWQILSNNWLVGRDLDDRHGVSLHKLVLHHLAGSSHTRDFLEEPEEILVGDGSHGPCFLCQLDMLLGLNSLVLASLKSGHFQQTAG